MKNVDKDHAIYIGDGVYAYFDGYQVYIYTSDGLHESDVIALEDYTMQSLIDYAKKCFGGE